MEPTIRMLWKIAKSEPLALTDEELHLLVSANTGKDSIKKLTKRELGGMIQILQNMKDSATGIKRAKKRSRGNIATQNQRKKVYKLTQELGWDKPARLNGFCKRMFGIASVEWLNYEQCSKLIEALKAMQKREEAGDGR